MNNNKHFIGIDVSKQTLAIAIYKQAEHLGHITVSNDLKGIQAFEKKAKQWNIDKKYTQKFGISMKVRDD